MTLTCVSHVEIQVQRTLKGGVIELFVDGADTAAIFSDAILNFHRKVPRLDNSKRKFLHRIERMATHLVATYDNRHTGFPWPGLGKLKQLLPNARPLTGLRGYYNEKHKAADGAVTLTGTTNKLARQARKYDNCYAASIPTDNYYRAARHTPTGFWFAGDALVALQTALFKNPEALEQNHAVANRIERSDEPLQRTTHETNPFDFVVDAMEEGTLCQSLACAALPADLKAGDCTPDCDIMDLQDYSCCDLPDCS